MIEIGRIEVSTTEVFIETRQKVLGLAEALGYDAIHSTRLATVFSELVRIGRDGNSIVDITIGIENRDGQNGLSIGFEYSGKVVPANSARIPETIQRIPTVFT